ncbi:hypothetical protein [Nocardia cyriacigeorgica]|uniref:hypothetical protein n=1 Tax=Nocardia cyriacigeorgica TaxID=135487 RepID=UPI0013D5C01F|nr:hypothetical protein [Nocardia cyriacigeorgica]MBF6437051.1 hypothetical protein [Nocardia cyriacigeorgica]MBF6452620.1 hypothetical protein [Nocardia cyriacigeorgica]MBF6479672.1 hypothetical protein [Nocardia cyriacigeorgica]MBF6549789.1 hypothetical protein [Nocardia cyriacigeorgica]NEW26133.1 hypothetical protein [Nocardia cyriacigeorgica]
MTLVHAGVVPTRRAMIYGVLGIAVTVALCLATIAAFGMNRVFTGLLAGAIAGVAVLVALFTRDAVVLTEGAIYRRTPWAETSIDWDRVVAGRFTLDERARWSLALDLVGGDEEHGELVLLSIPPVSGPVSSAYDMRKREQVDQIRNMLRRKKIPVMVLPEIAGALHEHWNIAPPTH